MKTLLNNEFAPITFVVGFVECAFSELSRAFIEWQNQIDAKVGTRTECRGFRARLSDGLLALDYLASPQDRYLLTETRSGWSAIFSNGLRANDVFSPVSHLPTLLSCRGLCINCTPDRSESADAEEPQIYGAVTFALYGWKETDWLNRIRSISVANDVSGWQFTAEGEVQPYELTGIYKKRRIVDRFTPEMLDSYCTALGIDLFNSDFYGGDSLLVNNTTRNHKGPTMPIKEARAHVHI